MCIEEAKRLFGPHAEGSDYKNYIEATNNCARIIKACENTCALSAPNVWRGNSPIFKCFEDKGCGKYPHYNAECIEKNKDELIRCCNRDCWPTKDMSCTKHCNRKYDDFVGKSKDPLIKIYDDSKNLSPGMFTKGVGGISDNSWVYYLIAIGVVAVIVVIVLIIKRK
jgi:hypothetical protein